MMTEMVSSELKQSMNEDELENLYTSECQFSFSFSRQLISGVINIFVTAISNLHYFNSSFTVYLWPFEDLICYIHTI